MRIVLIAVAIAALSACGQPPSETPAPTEADLTPPAAAPGPSAGIDGWEIDMTAYDKVGGTLPAVAVTNADGAAIDIESLRNRWTILGVWPADGAPADETMFLSALNSAVDQDPDLDLLVIHPDAPPSAAWRALSDGGASATALMLPTLPAYLLIGPDLTIEGYRGALSASPDDGIKSVIRGVAEIRSQIAAPQ